jgi:hypothetical protein
MTDKKIVKRTSVIVLFFFFWFTLTTDFLLSQDTKKKDKVAEAKLLIDEKRFDEAIEELKDFVKKEKEQKKILAEAYFQLARAHFLKNSNDKENIEWFLRMAFEEYCDYEGYKRKKYPDSLVKMAEKYKNSGVIMRPGRKKKTKIGLILGGIAVVGVIAYLLLKNKKDKPEPISISITSPLEGQTVCYEGLNPNGECIISVRGTKNGRDLDSSEKIVVLVKESGGSIWWVSGEIVTYIEANTGEWQMGNVSIGKPTDPNTQYKIIALVTSENLSSGQNLSDLPNHTVNSEMITITRGEPCQ